MKEYEIRTRVNVLVEEDMSAPERELVEAAKKATESSYSPYSHFQVGAALRLHSGEIITGSNQENAAYPSGLCAERTTLFWANSQYPSDAVQVLAIAARTDKGELPVPIPPCGACRQVILETEKRFGNAIKIVLYGARECYVIEDGVKALLPLSFDAGFLE